MDGNDIIDKKELVYWYDILSWKKYIYLVFFFGFEIIIKL